ncbi:ATP-binding protein [Angelakisella massiliensis]|uniref:ATP-binding protein n=1 Tax=Angelakisella massiliensis TaxID=1871018 RepID=UPI0024B10665|nr:ATP-binding protein [Angelakisella massiliensis]
MALRDPAEAAREQLAASRQRALEQAQQRRNEVYSQQPQLYQIDREIARRGMEIASSAMASDAQEQIERLQQEITGLQQEKLHILAQLGLPENYLEPPFSCPICQDTGFARGHRCQCWQKLYRRQAGKNLPGGGQIYQFDNFQLDYYPQSDDKGGNPRRTMEHILMKCMEYAEMVGRGEDPGSLLFCGKTGLGKTHLALAIAGRVAERGLLAAYTSAQSAVDHYERTRFNRNPSREDWDFLSAVEKADLLVIDDLGSEFNTAFTQSVLYNIINDRMMNGAATIITTNLEPAKLTSQYEQRIASRILCGYTSLVFAGRDIRMMKRMEGK